MIRIKKHEIACEDVNFEQEGCYSADNLGNVISYVFQDHMTGLFYERGIQTKLESDVVPPTYNSLAELIEKNSKAQLFYTLENKLIIL